MSRTLVIYYSRKGENYVNGSLEYIEKGNTETVAEYIRNAVGADLFEVDTVKEYDKSYMTCIEEAKKELRENARPELKEYCGDISEYDNIVIAVRAGGKLILWLFLPSLTDSISAGKRYFPL